MNLLCIPTQQLGFELAYAEARLQVIDYAYPSRTVANVSSKRSL